MISIHLSPRSWLPLASLQRLRERIVLRSYLLGLGASVILGFSYIIFFGGEQTQTAAQTLAQVERRTIVSSVKSTGKVTFASEQQLRFNQKGKVAKVVVKEGDRVTKGQLIAQLDTSSVIADIRQAQLSLAASALQLQQLKSDREKSLIDAENAVRQSERQLNDTRNTLNISREKLPTDIASAKRLVQEKESAVAQAKAAFEQAKATTLHDLGATADSILAKSEDLLDTLYGVLVNDASARRTSGVTGIDIYARLYSDIGRKNQTERAYYSALEMVKNMRSKYGNSLSSERDTDALGMAITDARMVALAIHALADSTYQLLQGATSDPNDFTVSDINSLKQSAVNARTSAAALVDEAETAHASLTGNSGQLTSITIKQKEDALTTAENSLQAARDNLRILETQTPADLEKQEADLLKVQDEVRAKQAALNATSKNVDVSEKLKQNDISQKSTSLQKTRNVLEDYQLTAPFDGIIRRLDYKVGDNLLDTGEDKFVTLENPDFLLITIMLDQVDVVRVRKGMPARITFDALPDQEFQGTIDEISSTPTEESSVVSYEVSIRLSTPKDLTILSGMTATLTIETMRKDNVLVVPNLALERGNGRVSVQRQNGESVPVNIGATDGRYTEILSGLTEGESILSMNVSAIQAQGSNQQNPAQLFRMGGGGGGFAPSGAVRTGGNGTRNNSQR